MPRAPHEGQWVADLRPVLRGLRSPRPALERQGVQRTDQTRQESGVRRVSNRRHTSVHGAWMYDSGLRVPPLRTPECVRLRRGQSVALPTALQAPPHGVASEDERVPVGSGRTTCCRAGADAVPDLQVQSARYASAAASTEVTVPPQRRLAGRAGMHPHHLEYHQTMDGYRWSRKADSSEFNLDTIGEWFDGYRYWASLEPYLRGAH